MDRNRAGIQYLNTDNRIQIDLDSLEVRPISPGEENNWNNLMREHHYLGFHSLTGKTLKYVALLDGQWVALIGWGSAAYKSNHREKWIGWSQEQQTQRLKFIVNNQRFLILPGIKIKNLASKVLALSTKRLPEDWLAAHGHTAMMAETFVDHSRFAGTCYRAAGWVPLGKTSGYGRKAGIYYYHGETKTIFVKPLHKEARKILSAPFLPPEYEGGEKALIDLNTVPIQSQGGLMEYLSKIRDPRKPRGIRHTQVSVLAVAICALLSGAKSFIGLGEWAANLSQELLKRFGCRYNQKLRKYVPPSVVPILNISDLLKSAAKATIAPAGTAVAVLEVDTKRKSVLVVEDSITSRMLLKSVIESAGFNVKTAVDGVDALTTLRTEDFDLVVSDIEMPRMNGFDLTARIRADQKLSQMPVVLVTSLSSREDRERGIDLGANAYIVKSSFDHGNLLEIIRRLI